MRESQEGGAVKIFIWKDLAGLTNRWHDGGGLAIVAPSLERAHETNPACAAAPPDWSADVSETEEVEFVFPNSGCC